VTSTKREEILARAEPQATVKIEVTLHGPTDSLAQMTEDPDSFADAALDGHGYPFGVSATGRIVP